MSQKIIGVTTDESKIAKMLGVTSNSDYGLCGKNSNEKLYAKLLPDGSFGKDVVRLISPDHAAKLETVACDAITRTTTNAKNILGSVPVIDPQQLDGNMNKIRSALSVHAKEIGDSVTVARNTIKAQPI